MVPITVADNQRQEQELEPSIWRKFCVDNEGFVRGIIAVVDPVINQGMKRSPPSHITQARRAYRQINCSDVTQLRQPAEAISDVLFL